MLSLISVPKVPKLWVITEEALLRVLCMIRLMGV
jgi:hypothetical protein